MKKMKQMQRGQGMTEYVILVALIAIVAIGGFTTLGTVITDKVGKHSERVSDLPE